MTALSRRDWSRTALSRRHCCSALTLSSRSRGEGEPNWGIGATALNHFHMIEQVCAIARAIWSNSCIFCLRSYGFECVEASGKGWENQPAPIYRGNGAFGAAFGRWRREMAGTVLGKDQDG